MRYTLLLHIVIMGIQAYVFGKRFRKTLKDIQDKNEQLLELNKHLNEMYYTLTQEQDAFEKKRNENNNIHEGLNSKQFELENRFAYLEGIRNKVGEKFQDKATSLKDFNELCKKFVSAHDEIEKVQLDIHQIEIELESYLKNWNDEVTKHNSKVASLRKDIESKLSDIAKMSEVENDCT